jgi:hypothetical protein
MAEKPPSPPDFSQNTLELQELIIKHGLAKVPAEDLERLGYERSPSGGIIRKGVQAEREEKRRAAEAEFAARWAEKERKAPFGELEVKLSYQEIQGRRLDEEEFARFKSTIEGRDDRLEEFSEEPLLGIKEAFDHSVAFEYLARNFEKTLKDLPEFDGVFQNLYEYMFYWRSIRAMFEKVDDHLFEEKDFKDKVFIGKEKLSVEEAEEIYNELERIKGVVSDRADFDARFTPMVWDDEFPVAAEGEEKVGKYVRTKNIATQAGLAKYVFGLLLEEAGMPDVAMKLQECDTLQAAQAYFEEVKDEVPEEVRNLERQLKDQMQGADIESKKELSKSLKNVQEQKKSRKQLLSGLAAYFNMPTSFGIDYARRQVTQLQDFIGRKGSVAERVFYLDGRPNRELDQDPGAISGDCTVGKPLPFEDPDYPAYNIKVFNGERTHIGNIYLVITSSFAENEATGEPYVVWHLDAIQIPSSISWKTEAKKLVDTIAKEAEKQGVDFITINDEISTVSNYDYISEAFLSLWKERGGESLNIDKMFPPDQEKYSDLQGSDDVNIVWNVLWARDPAALKSS